MSQDHASPVAGDASIESLFETTMRGFNKRQVEEYIGWLRGEVGSAQEEAHGARLRADEALRQVQQAREELAQVRADATNTVKPQHEEVSERIAQILRLADEEAAQKRVTAASEADSTLEAARDQSAKVLEAARSAAEGIISAARERAEKEAAAAKSEAENLLASASASSQATIDDAEARAAAVLSAADLRTSQITALQDERMSALREVHTDTLRRLEVVRGALEKVLTAEIDAGPPDSMIDATPLPAAGKALRAREIDLPSVSAQPETLSVPAPARSSLKRGLTNEVNLVNDGTLEDLSLEGETLRAADYAEGAQDEANTATGAIDQREIARAIEAREGEELGVNHG